MRKKKTLQGEVHRCLLQVRAKTITVPPEQAETSEANLHSEGGALLALTPPPPKAGPFDFCHAKAP